MTSHSISVWNPSGNSDSGLLSVRFDEERKLTGCTSEDGHVYFWSISGEKVGSCQVSDCDVTSLCFGPSSNLFCSSGENVFEIDVRTFKQTGRQWKIGREEINYISLNSTGTRLASADDDGRIRIAHVATTDTEPRIKAFRAKHENIVSCVEWATDQIIASARFFFTTLIKIIFLVHMRHLEEKIDLFCLFGGWAEFGSALLINNNFSISNSGSEARVGKHTTFWLKQSNELIQKQGPKFSIL